MPSRCQAGAEQVPRQQAAETRRCQVAEEMRGPPSGRAQEGLLGPAHGGVATLRGRHSQVSVLLSRASAIVSSRCGLSRDVDSTGRGRLASWRGHARLPRRERFLSLLCSGIFISVHATAVSGELGDVDVFLQTFVRYRPLTKWMPWSVLHVNIPDGKKIIQNIKKERAIYEEKS